MENRFRQKTGKGQIEKQHPVGGQTGAFTTQARLNQNHDDATPDLFNTSAAQPPMPGRGAAVPCSATTARSAAD